MKFQKAYQGDIILRMFDGDEKRMEQFHEDYTQNSNKSASSNREPTAQERKMADEFNLGITKSRLIKDYGLSNSTQFNTIITNVWRYRNSN